MAHGAIETVYKGYRFRSRLEARWAVFFDTLGMEWKYETEGYEVDGRRYLPDFWLPKARCWVEVKGDPEGLRKDFARMSVVLGPNSPLPGFTKGTSGFLILGEVPANPYTTILHPVLHRMDGGLLARTWGWFVQGGAGGDFLFDRVPSWLYFILGKRTTGDIANDASSTGWDVDILEVDGKGSWPRVTEAYRAARQARFEHGQSGGDNA